MHPHHSSVEKSAGLNKFGLSAGPRFDSGKMPFFPKVEFSLNSIFFLKICVQPSEKKLSSGWTCMLFSRCSVGWSRNYEIKQFFGAKKRFFGKTSVDTLACCEWGAEAPGLKPLRLPRAPRDSKAQRVCSPGAGFNPPEFVLPCGLPVSCCLAMSVVRSRPVGCPSAAGPAWSSLAQDLYGSGRHESGIHTVPLPGTLACAAPR